MLVSAVLRTKSTPPYAKFFMGHHWQTIPEAFICAIVIWRRFIDIFLIILSSANQIHSSEDFIKNFHFTYKFTFELSIQ